MKYKAIFGQSLSKSVAEAIKKSAAHYAGMSTEEKSAANAEAFVFDYFGVTVPVPENASQLVVEAKVMGILAERHERYSKQLGVGTRDYIAAPGDHVMDVALDAVQRAQDAHNRLINSDEEYKTIEHEMTFNEKSVKFNPYITAEELARKFFPDL